jgi:hypothetical protein
VRPRRLCRESSQAVERHAVHLVAPPPPRLPASTATYADLTVSSGVQPKAYEQRFWGGTSIFRSPVVSFVYERGWRQGFAWAGFPGVEEEYSLAMDYLQVCGCVFGCGADMWVYVMRGGAKSAGPLMLPLCFGRQAVCGCVPQPRAAVRAAATASSHPAPFQHQLAPAVQCPALAATAARAMCAFALQPAYGETLVDMSCGSGLFTRRFLKSGRFAGVVAADFRCECSQRGTAQHTQRAALRACRHLSAFKCRP